MCCENLQIFHNHVSLSNVRWDNNPRLQWIWSISLILSEFTPYSNFYFEYLCICSFKSVIAAGWEWWYMPFSKEPRRQRKGDFNEFKANLIYWEYCRIARSSQRNPFSKIKQNKINKEKLLFQSDSMIILTMCMYSVI